MDVVEDSARSPKNVLAVLETTCVQGVLPWSIYAAVYSRHGIASGVRQDAEARRFWSKHLPARTSELKRGRDGWCQCRPMMNLKQ